MTRWFYTIACSGLVACGSSAPQTANALSPQVQSATESLTDVNGSLELALQNDGQGPRVPLRYTCSRHGEQQVEMSSVMATTLSGTTVPETTTRMRVRANADRRELEQCHANFRYENVRVESTDTQMLQQMTPLLVGALEGFVGEFAFSRRGLVTDINLQPPGTIDAFMQQMLDTTRRTLSQMATPLPEQPVGVGARWQVVNQIEVPPGIALHVVTTYSLVERTGDIIVLESHTEIDGGEPRVLQMAENVTINFVSAHGSGHGRMTIDLAGVLPLQLQTTTSMSIAMDAGGQRVNMENTTTIQLGPVTNAGVI